MRPAGAPGAPAMRGTPGPNCARCAAAAAARCTHGAAAPQHKSVSSATPPALGLAPGRLTPARPAAYREAAAKAAATRGATLRLHLLNPFPALLGCTGRQRPRAAESRGRSVARGNRRVATLCFEHPNVARVHGQVTTQVIPASKRHPLKPSRLVSALRCI
jgi:hypothetical protein